MNPILKDQGSLILGLPPEEVKKRIEKLTRPIPSERNWDRFWCSEWKEPQFELMYHNGGIHWNANQIRARLIGELSAVTEGDEKTQGTELKYALILSSTFKKFALKWLFVVVAICAGAIFLGSQFQWVDRSIRMLWVVLPLLTIPSAIVFTWRYFWQTRMQPLHWLEAVFKKELKRGQT